MRSRPYPSDLTEEQWAILEPLLPPEKLNCRPRKHDMREVLNAIFYLNREGCTWRALPRDFPPWKTVYNWFAAWRDDGTWAVLQETLRQQARDKAGRPATHTARLDSQSVKTCGPGEQQGCDGGKKVHGRKRHIAVDSLGFLLAVVVTAANVDDARAAPRLLEIIQAHDLPSLGILYADGKYHNHAFEAHLAANTEYELRVVSRPQGETRFVLLPKRWVVERTFAWLGRYRRNSKDYEVLPVSSESMIEISSLHLLLKRLAPKQPPLKFAFKAHHHRRKAA